MDHLDALSMTMARWFAETTLVALALALVAHLVGRLRGPGPAIRHLLWLVVLAKLMTPPLVHWPWSLPVGLVATNTFEAPVARRATVALVPLRSAREVPLLDDREPEANASFASQPRSPVEPRPDFPSPVAWLVSAWLVGSVLFGADQVRRIVRFRRRLRGARPAPAWLVDEAEAIGRRMSVALPPIRVVDGLDAPLLWCLGRPVLFVPAGLLESLGPDRWRGVLAHELAHLRRGDHWVGRLELVALLAWWWNPLYWIARRRVDFEAELACDAWALWAFPGDRIEYAESLVRIGCLPRPAGCPSPALGVAGAGPSFERRLIMILRERVSPSASTPVLLAASLLAAIALPSWTLGAPTAALRPDVAISMPDDDDDDDKPAKKPARKPKIAEDKPVSKEAAAADRKAAEVKKDLESKLANRMEDLLGQLMSEDKIKEKLGPDFEKKMEEFGAKIEREIEAKFGPDFQKKMESLGKEIEEKFGPKSEFAKEMKELVEHLTKEFGPDFDKKMNEMAKGKSKPEKAMGEIDAKVKFQLDDVVKVEVDKARVEADKAKIEAENVKTKLKARLDARRTRAERTPEPPKARTSSASRDNRIKALESRIDGLMQDLKKLKAEQADNDKDDEESDAN